MKWEEHEINDILQESIDMPDVKPKDINFYIAVIDGKVYKACNGRSVWSKRHYLIASLRINIEPILIRAYKNKVYGDKSDYSVIKNTSDIFDNFITQLIDSGRLKIIELK